MGSTGKVISPWYKIPRQIKQRYKNSSQNRAKHSGANACKYSTQNNLFCLGTTSHYKNHRQQNARGLGKDKTVTLQI
jgi:hypothetical protein